MVDSIGEACQGLPDFGQVAKLPDLGGRHKASRQGLVRTTDAEVIQVTETLHAKLLEFRLLTSKCCGTLDSAWGHGVTCERATDTSCAL
jgi:hypothetical protein